VLIFFKGWVSPRDIVLLGGLGKVKLFSDLTETGICDYAARSVAPEPSTLPRVHKKSFAICLLQFASDSASCNLCSGGNVQVSEEEIGEEVAF
jgi:hypothetical protein